MTTPKQPSESGLSDRDLLSQFVRKRDEASFRLLVRRHSGLVWCVCQRMLRCEQDREDVFQATFLKLLIHADRKTWHESLGGWLHRVAYLLSLKSRASRKRERVIESADEPEVANNCFEEIQQQESERALHEAIAQLPRRNRQTIVLYYFQNKSQEEAAVEMGCSPEAIKSLLKRGRQRLHVQLACRGLSCSLTLVAFEQTLTAATPMLPKLIENTVLVGFNHPVGGGTMPSSPHMEYLCQGEMISMLQNGLANKSLAVIGCTTLFFLGTFGIFSGVYGGDTAYAASMPITHNANEVKVDGAHVNIRLNQSPNSPTGAMAEDIEQLIEQLGKGTKSDKSAAEKRLVQIGEPVLPLLQAALAKRKNKSFLIRARRVLNHITELSIAVRWKPFPGWKRYCEIVGDTRSSRALFVQIYEAHGPILDASDRDPEKARQLLIESFTKLHPQKADTLSPVALKPHVLPPADIAMLLLIAGDPKISASWNDATEVKNLLSWKRELIADNEIVRLLTIEFATTVAGGRTDEIFNLYMTSLGVRDAAIAKLVERLSANPTEKLKHDAAFRVGSALHMLGRLGNSTHIATIEPWLENASNLNETIQLRDVAVNTLVHLSGQKCNDYGFKHDFKEWGDGNLDMIETVQFKEGQTRQAAIAKWRAWVKENPIKKPEELVR